MYQRVFRQASFGLSTEKSLCATQASKVDHVCYDDSYVNILNQLKIIWYSSNSSRLPHDINLISVRMSRRLHYSLMYLCPRNTSSVIPTIIIQTIKFILLGVSVSTSISSGIVKVHMLHGNYSVVDLVRSLFLFGGLRL